MLARIRMIAAVTILAGGYLLSSPRPVAASQAFGACPEAGPIILDEHVCDWCGDMAGCSLTSCHFDQQGNCGCNYSC